jgi:nucleotide-binding universal stress UspA family protein
LLRSILEVEMSAMPQRRKLGNVVVGTDFTRHAQDAIARAMWLPLEPGSNITLVHALPGNLPAVLHVRLRAAAGAMMKGMEATAVAEMDRAKLSGVEVLGVIDTGRAVEAVSARARDGRAELVVVGRGTRRSVSERLLGSSAEQIVRAVPCSVLVVASTPEGPYRRPLVGVDVSDASKRAVELAARLVEPGSDPIEVVHAYDAPYLDMVSPARKSQDRLVTPMTPVEVEGYLGDVERSARSRLDEWMPSVDAKLSLRLHRGDPRQVLLQQAAEHRADLIVVGHQDLSTLGRLFLGSVAEAVVRSAGCDVLVVR